MQNGAKVILAVVVVGLTVSVWAAEEPNIVVPGSLSATCQAGGSVSKTLAIQNTGTAALNFTIFQASGNEGKKISGNVPQPPGTSYNEYGVAWEPDRFCLLYTS
ncbi:MAG: hypothetical protein N3A38_15335, partial [Planctomycetota bacterium]|nr:hypothetical protein [Planctomycetota bacterium]